MSVRDPSTSPVVPAPAAPILTAVASIAALKALAGTDITGTVEVLSRIANAIPDGLGGVYTWNSTDTRSDDSATLFTIIQPDSGGVGRWNQVTTGSSVQSGTGAVARSVQSKERDVVSALDFGLVAGGTTALGSANKTALQAAIDSFGVHGGEVYIPDGFYYINPGVVVGTSTKKNITISGGANGFSQQPLTRTLASYQGGTVISWAAAGAIGFDLSQIDNTAPDGNYPTLRNLVIAGTAALAVDTGIKGSGIFTLENLSVEGHQKAGIWMYEFCNNVKIDRVGANGNTGGAGYGLLVGPGGASFFDNTLFRVSNSVFRNNTVGARIEQATNYEFDHCVFESNTGIGLDMYRYHTPATSIHADGTPGAGHSMNSRGRFISINFENNGYGDVTGATPQVFSTAQTPSFDAYDTPSYMEFENCVFAGYITSAVGVWQPNFKITSGQAWHVKDCAIGTKDPLADGAALSPVLLGASSTVCVFDGISGNPVYTDTGSDNQKVNSLQTSITVTLTGCTASVTGTAYMTIRGNMVSIDIPTLSGTQNNVAHTIQFTPGGANAVPAHVKYLPGTPMLDNVTWTMGYGDYNGTVANELKIFRDAAGTAWSGANAITFKGGTLTYTIK